MKIPAVTRVEEWTMAEMGVGADIAAGNQAVIGNWALFVMAQIIIIVTTHFVFSSFLLMFIIVFIFISINLMVIIMITSPIRLNIIVIKEFIFLVLLG